MPGYWLMYLIIIFLMLVVFFLLWEKGKGSSKYKALVNELPLGACMVDKRGRVLWLNQLFSFQTGTKIEVGEQLAQKFSLHLVTPGLNKWQNRLLYFVAQEIIWHGQEGILYLCQDLTEEINLFAGKKTDAPVLMMAQLDNRAEVLNSVREEQKLYLSGAIERTLAEWVESLQGFLSQIGESRYLIILTQGQLKRAEKDHFSILDKMREIKEGNTIPLTLSMGVGVDEHGRLGELGRLAQAALDLAQERGGDQLVRKSPCNGCKML